MGRRRSTSRAGWTFTEFCCWLSSTGTSATSSPASRITCRRKLSKPQSKSLAVSVKLLVRTVPSSRVTRSAPSTTLRRLLPLRVALETRQ